MPILPLPFPVAPIEPISSVRDRIAEEAKKNNTHTHTGSVCIYLFIYDEHLALSKHSQQQRKNCIRAQEEEMGKRNEKTPKRYNT